MIIVKSHEWTLFAKHSRPFIGNPNQGNKTRIDLQPLEPQLQTVREFMKRNTEGLWIKFIA